MSATAEKTSWEHASESQPKEAQGRITINGLG